MGEKSAESGRKSPTGDRWGFLAASKSLLSAFPHATTGQKAGVLAMALCACMFVALGSVKASSPSVVGVAFVLATLLIYATAAYLLYLEQEVVGPRRCRHIPIFPLAAQVCNEIKAALGEIRQDAADQIREKNSGIPDDKIRANIFLLAQVQGGSADGKWKLVIPKDLSINMNHPPERQLQFSVGQGASGVSFRDGTFQLTRRQTTGEGDWDRKFQMTTQLDEQIHKNLKWIVSLPLLMPNTMNALGVLNIDGLEDVTDDNLLYGIASRLGDKVDVIAKTLSLQPSTCVAIV